MVFTIINSFLHLLATVTWIGGMIYATLVLMPSLGELDPPARGKLMGAAIKRYMPLAWAAIALLIITGFIRIGPAVSNTTFWTSNYGIILGVKLLIVAVMVIIGTWISFILGSRAAKLGPSPEGGKIQEQMGKLALLNLTLGVIVLLLVSVLRVV